MKLLKPKVLFSECFFAPCRYNGAYISDDFVKSLQNYVEVIKVCPEVSIGLGTPRDPIVIQKNETELKLIQPSTGLDLSQKMQDFSKEFVKNIDIDGAILKSKSPSCGVYSAKYFGSNQMSLGKGPGFFAMELLKAFPNIPIEEEKRLLDKDLRFHFLTRLYAVSDLNNSLKNMKEYSELINFHTRHKFLLMFYNQNIMKSMGKFVANSSKEDFEKVKLDYKDMFLKAINSKAKKTSHVNVLEHIFGYFSKWLSNKERRHFMEVLRLFKEDKLDIFVPLEMLRSFAFRTNEEYILNQSYLNPFPRELL